MIRRSETYTKFEYSNRPEPMNAMEARAQAGRFYVDFTRSSGSTGRLTVTIEGRSAQLACLDRQDVQDIVDVLTAALLDWE